MADLMMPGGGANEKQAGAGDSGAGGCGGTQNFLCWRQRAESGDAG